MTLHLRPRTIPPQALPTTAVRRFPRSGPTITPCCSAPTAARPAASPFKRLTIPETPIRSRAAFSPERSRALNARNTPEHFRKNFATLRRSVAPLEKRSSFRHLRKIFASNAPGCRMLFRQTVGSPDLTPLSGAVRLFSLNPRGLLGIVLFRSRRRAHASLPPCRMAPVPRDRTIGRNSQGSVMRPSFPDQVTVKPPSIVVLYRGISRRAISARTLRPGKPY